MTEQPSDAKRLTLDYVQPLVIEEAAKSGLFPGSLRLDLLKWAKTYHRYNIHVADIKEAILQGYDIHSEVYEGLDRRLRRGEQEVTQGLQEILNKLGQ